MSKQAKSSMPKFWFTRFLSALTPSRFVLDFEVDHPGNVSDRKLQNDKKVEFIQASRYMRPFLEGRCPTYMYFSRGTSIAEPTKDAFTTIGGLMVVSPKVRDVMAQFDLGANRLIEVPVCKNIDGVPSKFPPHFVLHVVERKSCFVPEASINVEQPEKWDGSPPDPDTKWEGVYDTDTPALHAAAAKGVDMWCDPDLQYSFFFSDRLKRALDDAQIKSQGLKFFEAITVS